MLQQPDWQAEVGMVPRRSVEEKLRTEAAELRTRLYQVEAALDALTANPEVGEIINLVSKVYDRY